MRVCRWPLLALSLLALCGCARFRYALVEPNQFAQRIGRQPVTLHLPPVDYRLQRDGKRLAIRIENPNEQPVDILTNKSYIVDPKGRSHPLPGQTIAPHGFLPLMLPPVPLTYKVYTPSSTYSSPWWVTHRYPFAADWYEWYDMPNSYSVQERTPNNWEWGEGPVRLHLTYQHQGQAVEQQFLLERRPGK